MNDYRLDIMECNTYEQESTVTIYGKDSNPNDFLERCFQYLEKGVSDPGLIETKDEPDGYGYAGGFCEMGKNLYENGVLINDVLDNFPW